MKIRFQPMPGLTIVTIIALAILIALGTWQYQRLQWKTELLSDVEAVVDAAPFTSISEAAEALSAGEPIDFRRIGTEGIVVASDPYFVFSPINRDISWRVFLPVTDSGPTVFAALGSIPDAEKEMYTYADDTGQALTSDGRIRRPLIGYVRLARPSVWSDTKSTPNLNRWFGFNPMPESRDWGYDLVDADMRFYIDTVPGAQSADSLPPRRPDIRNNHFDYMLTWYGLAGALLVIYLIMHRRAGRLGRV